MVRKILQNLALLVLGVGFPMMAQNAVSEQDFKGQDEVEPATSVIPGELKRETAVVEGDFFGSNCGSSSVSYLLDVPKDGDYVLYLNAGNKPSGDRAMDFDVYVNSELQRQVRDKRSYGGNWNVFMVKSVPLALKAGVNTLKIVSQSDRWYVSSAANPYVQEANHVTVLDGAYPLSVDLLHPDTTSSLAFLTYAAFGMDNSGYGPSDHKSVLVVGQDVPGGGKTQSPFEKARLRYVIEVKEEGIYPVSVTGCFYPGRKQLEDNSIVFLSDSIINFNILLKATWTNGQEYISNAVPFPTIDLTNPDNIIGSVSSNTSGLTHDYTATSNITLKKGTYYLEVTTDYPNLDCFSMKSLVIEAPTETIENAVPVGKYVPTVVIEQPTDTVYWNKPFTLGGTLLLDQEDDVLKSLKVYQNGVELGDAVVGEGGSFTYDVSAISELGSYTFAVKAATERGYEGEDSVRLVVEKQKFEILVLEGENGTITSESAGVVEDGEDITFTVTANEGYLIETLSVDGSAVEAASGEKSYEYTFEQVTEAGHMIEASFKKQEFTISATAGANGTIVSETNGVVKYGEDITFTVTANEGYLIETLSVDGSAVEAASGEKSYEYTFEQVTEAGHMIEASFKKQEFTISATAGANGTIVSETNGVVEYGEDITFVITPDEGYSIISLLIDGEAVDFEASGMEYTFENVTAPHTIEATFGVVSGIEEVSGEPFVLPVDGGFMVQSTKLCNIILYNLTGSVIDTWHQVGGEVFVAVPEGSVRIIRIEVDQTVLIQKIVK